MPKLASEVKKAVDDIYPFYMPGHKRNKSFFDFDMLDIDVTETSGTDNLHNANGIIAEAMRYAAKACKADESLFMVNGSSGGTIAAILATVAEGESILVARNTHKSVFTGMIFSGAYPYYILPEMTSDGLQGGINPDELRKMLYEHPDIYAVLITSPTFEGFVSDIRTIARISHEAGCALIVDEAHGAHFPYSDYFPQSAIELGADIVIQSLHKTLPALTQMAIIHMAGDFIDRDRLKHMLTITQSTSPSYIFMTVADNVIRKITEDKSIFGNYAAMLGDFRERLSPLKKIRLLGKEQIGRSSIFDVDMGRLCFVIESADMVGKELEDLLRDKYRVQMEYSGLNYIIGISSPADVQEGFDRLAHAIEDVSDCMSDKIALKTPLFSRSEPQVFIEPRKAFYAKNRTTVPLQKSEGKISAGFVIPYPPGIPILAPGELITDECIDSIEACIKSGLEIVGDGFKNNIIAVL